jgi:hypothetical protein
MIDKNIIDFWNALGQPHPGGAIYHDLVRASRNAILSMKSDLRARDPGALAKAQEIRDALAKIGGKKAYDDHYNKKLDLIFSAETAESALAEAGAPAQGGFGRIRTSVAKGWEGVVTGAKRLLPFGKPAEAAAEQVAGEASALIIDESANAKALRAPAEIVEILADGPPPSEPIRATIRRAPPNLRERGSYAIDAVRGAFRGAGSAIGDASRRAGGAISSVTSSASARLTGASTTARAALPNMTAARASLALASAQLPPLENPLIVPKIEPREPTLNPPANPPAATPPAESAAAPTPASNRPTNATPSNAAVAEPAPAHIAPEPARVAAEPITATSEHPSRSEAMRRASEERLAAAKAAEARRVAANTALSNALHDARQGANPSTAAIADRERHNAGVARREAHHKASAAETDAAKAAVAQRQKAGTARSAEMDIARARNRAAAEEAYKEAVAGRGARLEQVRAAKAAKLEVGNAAAAGPQVETAASHVGHVAEASPAAHAPLQAPKGISTRLSTNDGASLKEVAQRYHTVHQPTAFALSQPSSVAVSYALPPAQTAADAAVHPTAAATSTGKQTPLKPLSQGSRNTGELISTLLPDPVTGKPIEFSHGAPLEAPASPNRLTLAAHEIPHHAPSQIPISLALRTEVPAKPAAATAAVNAGADAAAHAAEAVAAEATKAATPKGWRRLVPGFVRRLLPSARNSAEPPLAMLPEPVPGAPAVEVVAETIASTAHAPAPYVASYTPSWSGAAIEHSPLRGKLLLVAGVVAAAAIGYFGNRKQEKYPMPPMPRPRATNWADAMQQPQAISGELQR